MNVLLLNVKLTGLHVGRVVIGHDSGVTASRLRGGEAAAGRRKAALQRGPGPGAAVAHGTGKEAGVPSRQENNVKLKLAWCFCFVCFFLT